MSIFTSNFFSLTGQKERISNVGAVFKEIGSNIISGKLLTGVQSNTGVKSIDKILTVATSPVGIASTALVGAGIATGIKAGITSKTAQTAVGTGATGSITTATAKPIATNTTTGANPTNTQPTLPKTVSQSTKTEPSKTNPKVSPSDNGVFGTTVKTEDAIDLVKNNLPTVKDVIEGQKNPETSTGEVIKDSLPSSINASDITKQVSKLPTKTSTKTYKKKPTVKKSSSKSKAKPKKKTVKKKAKKTGFGTEAQYNRKGGKDVFYTKTGQPYIKDKNGRARFIKKSK